MIVDYNYKPYVFNASPGITQYIPPAANNKGFICLVGYDDGGNYYVPDIDFISPSGGTVTVSAFGAPATNFWSTGSFFDLYAQFKRESTAASTGIIKLADIGLFRASTISGLGVQFVAVAPVFFPITYSKLTFNLSSPGSTWDVPLTIITLY